MCKAEARIPERDLDFWNFLFYSSWPNVASETYLKACETVQRLSTIVDGVCVSPENSSLFLFAGGPGPKLDPNVNVRSAMTGVRP